MIQTVEITRCPSCHKLVPIVAAASRGDGPRIKVHKVADTRRTCLGSLTRVASSVSEPRPLVTHESSRRPLSFHDLLSDVSEVDLP